MTRVLAYCDYLAEPMVGGAEIVTAQIYRRLARAGFETQVISGVPGRGGSESPVGLQDSVAFVRGVDLSRLVGAQISISPGLAWHSRRAMRSFRPDVVHVSGLHFLGSVVGAAAARRAEVPLVTTCHLADLEALPTRTRRLGQFHESTLGRFILERSTKVIAVSETVASHIVDLGVEPERVVVVENGVDTQRFRPGHRGPTQVVVTFVGRLIENKGPLQLVEAFSRLPDDNAVLRIVGSGPLEADLRDRARRDQRIQMLGQRSDVAELLADSDIFVRTSTTEGRSLAILEAMAAGCAVVASDIPANAELISHGETGMLVSASDSSALSGALATLVGEAGLRESLGAAARRAVEGCSWDAATDATALVLEAAARTGG